MTERDPESNDAPAGAERLFEALRSAATDTATRETLRGLGDRARNVVEELARNARTRAAAAEARAQAEAEAARRDREPSGSSRPGPGAAAFVPPDLSRRLDDLKGCVVEVADTLEATIERLETLEEQLGDPGERLDAKLARGVEHCEQVLRGIEYRVERAAAKPAHAEPSAGEPAAPATVMVVAASSARRASLCVDLEREGLRCLAASNLVAARRLGAQATAALLVPQPDAVEAAETLEDWKDGVEAGLLPPALVLDDAVGPRGLAEQAAARSFPVAASRHGAAALAAGLMRVADAAGRHASPQSTEEQ